MTTSAEIHKELCKKFTTFNDDNLPTHIDDLGDEATAVDDVCTRNWYARNGGNGMLDRVKRTETLGVNCATTPSLPADMLTSIRNIYDDPDNDWNSYLPVKGDVVTTEEIDSWSGATPTWVTTARTVYDDNGRPTESYDPLGHKTSTEYTPDEAGPLTQTVVTNPAGRIAVAKPPRCGCPASRALAHRVSGRSSAAATIRPVPGGPATRPYARP